MVNQLKIKESLTENSSLHSRAVRMATPPSDKLLSLTSGINSNLTALLSLLQVQFRTIIMVIDPFWMCSIWRST